MVQVGYDNDDDKEYGDPIRYDLGHENRYEGTIAEVSAIQDMEFKYDDEPQERLVITFRTPLEELDVDDETREALTEYISEEVEARRENDYEVDHPEDAVELVMIPTAKVTPALGKKYSQSKLFGTLSKLGLAEATDEGDVTLYDRNGDEAEVFADLDEDASEEEKNSAFSNYLQQNLTGMKVEYEVSNAKRGTEDEYSSVNKVIDLVEDPQVD